MSTTLAKARCTVERKWYHASMPPASPWAAPPPTAAVLLRGKHKVTFTPNVDCGDYVDHRQLRQGCSYRQARLEQEVSTTTHSELDRRPEEAVQYRTLMAENSRPGHDAAP